MSFYFPARPERYQKSIKDINLIMENFNDLKFIVRIFDIKMSVNTSLQFGNAFFSPYHDEYLKTISPYCSNRIFQNIYNKDDYLKIHLNDTVINGKQQTLQVPIIGHYIYNDFLVLGSVILKESFKKILDKNSHIAILKISNYLSITYKQAVDLINEDFDTNLLYHGNEQNSIN